MKFNVGDRVRMKANNEEGVVEGYDPRQEPTPYCVRFSTGSSHWLSGVDLWHVSDLPGPIEHPAHYGGGDNPYEAIKVIEAWGLGFALGNLVKYVARAGKKDQAKELEDLKKGRFYLDRHISNLEAKE